MRPSRVWIGVHAAKIGQRCAVGYGAFWCAKQVFDDRSGIGASDRVHGVKADMRTARKHCLDRREVEQGFHQVNVGRHRVHDLDDHGAEFAGADSAKVDVG